jgi:hypothetical protein
LALSLDKDLFAGAINLEDGCLGEHIHTFGLLEKGLVAQGMKIGAPKLIGITDISGNQIGNAATTIGNDFLGIDHGHPGIGLDPFEPTGCLGTQGYAAYYDYVLRHGVLLH